MRLKELHAWQVTIEGAREIQRQLAREVVLTGDPDNVTSVAGVDVSSTVGSGLARAAVVVLAYPSFDIADLAIAESTLDFPYIPGLLSFREVPLLARAFEKLRVEPQLVMVDGQGYAHPRRFGLASHLGLLLNVPTIGCAKSRLCGEFSGVPDKPGEWCSLTDSGEVIGAVVRTRSGCKPVFVSCGHRVGLESAVRWVLRCCHGYRLPEPIRLAHWVASTGLLSGATISSKR